jgi:hypothetical protein
MVNDIIAKNAFKKVISIFHSPTTVAVGRSAFTGTGYTRVENSITSSLMNTIGIAVQ